MTVGEILQRTGQLDPGKDYNIDIIDGVPWVFFHASWSWQDWIRDFFVWTKDFFGGKVHSGYLKEFEQNVQDGLIRDISILNLQGHRYFVFAGYSRGAALALIAQYQVTYSVIGIVSSAILVGRPGTFLKWPTTMTRGKIHEVRYGKDIVSSLPPWYPHSEPDIRIPSVNKCPWKSIKDHGSYSGSTVAIPGEWV